MIYRIRIRNELRHCRIGRFSTQIQIPARQVQQAQVRAEGLQGTQAFRPAAPACSAPAALRGPAIFPACSAAVRPAQAEAGHDNTQALGTRASFAATSGAARSLADRGPG